MADPYDLAQPIAPEDEAGLIAQLAALEQPQLDQTQEPGYQPSRYQRFVESLGGLENATAGFEPRGFLEGLVSGTARSLGSAGTRARAERQKFESNAATRQATRDEANRKATEAARTMKAERLRGGLSDQRIRQRDQEKYQRDNPIVDQALIDAYPQIPSLKGQLGRPVSRDILQRAAIEADQTKAKAQAENAAEGLPVRWASLPDNIKRVQVTQYATNGTEPKFGYGKAARQDRIDFYAYAGKVLPPTTNIAANRASMQSNQRSLSTLQTGLDQTKSFQKTAKLNSDRVIGTLAKLPETGIRFTNGLLRSGLGNLGSTEVSDFQTALGIVQPEFARILQSGLTGTGGQLTVESRRDLKSIIDGDFTKKQLRHALDILNSDAQNKVKAGEEQVREINDRISALSPFVGETAAPGTAQSRIGSPIPPAYQGATPGGFFQSNIPGGH